MGVTCERLCRPMCGKAWKTFLNLWTDSSCERLCRLMCGKAVPFHGQGLSFLRAPPGRGRSPRSRRRPRDDKSRLAAHRAAEPQKKSETYCTSGGRAVRTKAGDEVQLRETWLPASPRLAAHRAAEPHAPKLMTRCNSEKHGSRPVRDWPHIRRQSRKRNPRPTAHPAAEPHAPKLVTRCNSEKHGSRPVRDWPHIGRQSRKRNPDLLHIGRQSRKRNPRSTAHRAAEPQELRKAERTHKTRGVRRAQVRNWKT
jgi:hypothetical protein